MSKKRKAAGLLLASAMVLLSACGSNNTAGTNNNGSAASTNTGTAAVQTESAETYEVVMGFPMLGNTPKDIAEVEAAINEITVPKINATVKLMAVPFGQWNQQVNLMLASSEKLDIMLTDFAAYSNAVSKNQLTDLTDLIDQYGEGIKTSLGSKLDAAKINGRIYATPSNKLAEGGSAIVMRKDIIDKLGIDLSAVTRADDLDQVFQTVKEKESGMTPLASSNTLGGMSMTALIDSLDYDTLTDGLGVLMTGDASMKVVNLYETPEYLAALQKIHGWYTAGYLPKDAATIKTQPNDVVRAGKAFATITSDGPTAADKETANNGTEMVKISLQKPMHTTQTVLGLMWAIPTNNTKNAAKAMEFLNLTYSDKDIINLINFGIEGKHYTKKSDDVIVPVEGDNGYVVRQSFMFGDTHLTYLLDGENPQGRVEEKIFSDNMVQSKALGFIPNMDPIKTEVSAVNNVINQYKVALETGSVDPEKILPQFNEKLKAAGIDKIIAEKQKQLDEWLAASGK
ncbi:ABC transporter substrate-binding protein [Paenibacillus sp. MMS20-IR301]|uniref:ABC transporter substrate-binding protein n=1 Tax=Paenibacillus sp. MMS20-IR301 TaxID=2895946 RepID=UPI0028E9ED9C|nr:ABC transporter substrate-binding protein [Paenibacillus sp. MMS20-IR301]WNS41828.1 ABC transporter substrate-binding protein [Paenibacillus sp. MMS20-IR301]